MYAHLFQTHAKVLKAMAHSKRLEIIHLIRDQELCVGEIFSMLDLPQANVSQHLMILRQAKIVQTRKVGKQVMYRLAHANIFQANDLIRQFLAQKTSGAKQAENFTKDIDQLMPVFVDPVCQMKISPITAGFYYQYKRKTFYFCASGCLREFKKAPKKYVKN